MAFKRWETGRRAYVAWVVLDLDVCNACFSSSGYDDQEATGRLKQSSALLAGKAVGTRISDDIIPHVYGKSKNCGSAWDMKVRMQG